MTLKNNKFELLNNENELIVCGELTFETVMAVYEESKAAFRANHSLVINFKEVTECDSSSLALILKWLRTAKIKNVSLKFSTFPPKMSATAQLNGIEQILTQCN